MQHTNVIDPNPIQRAISHFQAINKLATALGVTPQAVSFWRDGERQFPAEKCPLLERLTDRSVRCEELRPDVDWAYIRNTAPDTPQAQEPRAQAAPESVACNTDALPPISDLPPIVATPAAPAWDGVDRRAPVARALPLELERRAALAGGA